MKAAVFTAAAPKHEGQSKSFEYRFLLSFLCQ